MNSQSLILIFSESKRMVFCFDEKVTTNKQWTHTDCLKCIRIGILINRVQSQVYKSLNSLSK